MSTNPRGLNLVRPRLCAKNIQICEQIADNAVVLRTATKDNQRPDDTGVLNFLKKYPAYNGEGVTIAIFDSGVDAKSAGLQALVDENIDPDDHVFTFATEAASPKKRLNSSQKSDNTNGDAEESFIMDASGEDGLDTDDLIVKDEADDDDEIVDEIGEIDKESFVDELEKSTSEVQRSINEANNGENEDSLNLTIGEDEEKIFQDEDTEEKSKDKPEKSEKESKSSDVSKSASTGTKVANENGDEKSSGKAADKEDSKAGKKDDSDQKTSTTKSSTKDDKESAASKSSKTKTSSSSSSSGSRNLWVSGLSSLTRATDLKIIFSKYGKVVGAKVVTNTRTPGTRCYGLVTMGSTSDASKCIEHLHRTELHGRIISVERTKSDICVSKTTKADGEKKTDTSSDRKKTEKEVKKDDTTKEAIKSDGEKSTDAKKRDVTTERKRENAHPQRQRITARISREQNEATAAQRRPVVHRPRPVGEQRDVLSFQKIRDERERQRLRERERKLREEERRRVEARRRQREEEERLLRERERLKKERLRLEREKADLLRLERERQKLEREKIELERLELKRQQLKIEEAKRAIKRPAEHDRYADSDRKRTTSDRRFEPPPPPRFDTSISSRSTAYDSRASDKKRIDDYSTSKRDDYKRDDYKRDPFKRPVSDYPKRDIDSSRHTSSSSYDARAVPVHRNEAIGSSSSKERYAMTPSQSSFSSRVRDERDSRATNLPSKSRYLESSSGDSRYADERSGATSSWPSAASSTVKPFSHMQSVAGNDPWGQNKSESWRSLDQNEDRYDRTYNERKSQVTSSQYIDAPRQNSFIGRPQERYNSQISSRFENGRF